jgi:hypothetical protein
MADKPWCGWCGEALFGAYDLKDVFRHRIEPTLVHSDGRPATHTHGVWVRWGSKPPEPGLSSEVPEAALVSASKPLARHKSEPKPAMV